jgi:hypothetical protein
MEQKLTVLDVRPVAEAYYQAGHVCGGNLHIVLDDGNVEDGHVLFCKKAAHEAGDAVGEQLADLLLQLSKTQRMKIYNTMRRA